MSAVYSTPISPKVNAAALGTAGTTIVLYLLNLIPWVGNQDDLFKGAVALLVTTAVTAGLAYITPDPLRDTRLIQATPDEVLESDEIDPEKI